MRVFSLIVCIFLICACVWGQGTTAQINGNIKDASGLAVPGAEIKVTQTATGAVRTVTSGADGGYILANLPIGPYMLEVTKEGFSKYVQTGIVLQVDANPTVDVALKIGSVTEQVTVEAGAALVETHSTGVGQVVDNQRVAEMPLNGRNPIELVFLAGMASTAGGVGTLNAVRAYPTIIVSVAGGQGSGMSYLLDGANYQDPYNSATLPLPFPDALQEFKVETSSLPAQYGFHSAAAVNAVTKSGTNEFHGDAFEFIRNGDLNARDFFASTRDTLKRNQFGGVVGGPVKKDKLFFFGGIQRTSQRSDPAQNIAFVPTPAMMAGDFTTIASPLCQGSQKTLAAASGFVGNKISPSLLNPVTVAVQKTMPVSSDPCGRANYGLVANQDEDLTVGRVDWQQSEKNSIFGRWTGANLNVASTYDGKNPLSINTYGVHDYNWSVAVGDTYLIGNGVVSSFRLAGNRTNVVKLEDNYGSWKDFGSNFSPIGGKVIDMTVSSAFSVGTSASVPGESHTGINPSLNEDISWVKGAHQFSFGTGWYRQAINYWSGLLAVGSQTFNGSVSGLPMADFLLGQTSSFGQGVRYGFYNRETYFALYAQDAWKLTSRLTVNYGIRYEPYISPYNKQGQTSHYDPTLFAQNVHSTVYTNAPAGLVFPGDSQYHCDGAFNCSQWAKFFPRVGLVWDPKGDGKMTVRASFGMFGDRQHMFYYNNNSMDPPFGNNTSQSNVNMTDPWATYPGGNPIPQLAISGAIGHSSPTTKFPTAGPFNNHVIDGYQAPYMNQWNLSIQRQVGADWLFTANYLGNSTIHLTTSYAADPAVFLGLGACTLQTVNAAGAVVPTNFSTCSTTANQNQRRVNYIKNPLQGQYYAAISQVAVDGTATYDALYLSAQKRTSHGINILANYTWSHCISDPWDVQTASASVDYSIRQAYRSNCNGSDLRQLFNLNMVAQSPKFANRWLRILASDWQVAPIIQVKSAQFFTVSSGTDQALTTIGGQTANLLGNPYPTNQGVNGWISPGAFGKPALGTYGNLGLYNIKGPSIFQVNVALSRTFPVWGEKRTLQLRAEAFNLPNHLNPSTPAASLTAGNFGQITSDISGNNGVSGGDYRIIQLAAKFVF